MSDKKILFPGVKDGEAFKVGDIEFIKFPGVDGKTPVVAKESLFDSVFGDSNNLTESKVLKKLEVEVLPQIIAEVGEENVCTFKTDPTTLDGLKPYHELESRISLPTLDFYRANVEIFDKHKVDDWWWLATPETALPHYKPLWTVCVSPSGFICCGCFDYRFGVRPILIFESSIFGSSEE